MFQMDRPLLTHMLRLQAVDMMMLPTTHQALMDFTQLLLILKLQMEEPLHTLLIHQSTPRRMVLLRHTSLLQLLMEAFHIPLNKLVLIQLVQLLLIFQKPLHMEDNKVLLNQPQQLQMVAQSHLFQEQLLTVDQFLTLIYQQPVHHGFHHLPAMSLHMVMKLFTHIFHHLQDSQLLLQLLLRHLKEDILLMLPAQLLEVELPAMLNNHRPSKPHQEELKP
jgi:hypothetical protein